MGKYTKLFETEQQYNTYMNGTPDLPNVSYIEQTQDVKYTPNPTNGHPYVDLGLPSGALGATCNVGASSPEEYGGYYAGGETSEKTGSSAYSYNDYVYGPYDYEQFTDFGLAKYNNTDGLIELEPSDDVASIVMGGGWHIPHKDQWQELLNNTTSTSTTINGVFGTQLTSINNGETLFFPYAGGKENPLNEGTGTQLYSEGTYTTLGASTVNGEEPGRTWSFASGPEVGGEGELESEFYVELTNESFRYYGVSVRGVIGEPPLIG